MDSQRSRAAATFGSDFMREARSKPNESPAAYKKGGAVKKAVAAFKKADAKQDAKLVAKAVKSVAKKATGGAVGTYAAGGVGKLRKGQAKQPGRGEKLV